MVTTIIMPQLVFFMIFSFLYLVFYTFEFANNFVTYDRSHQAQHFVVSNFWKIVLKVIYSNFCDF